jgi:uncharacterized protein (DUF2236 family)
LGTWVTALQNMLPALGTAVEEKSTVFDEPLQRVMRSMYPIQGVVYDQDRARETGRSVVGYHGTITNIQVGWRGRKYHALDPDTFYWAHATFFMQMIRTAEWACGGLTVEQKRQLYDENVRWYAQYGLSMRPVPKSWEDFQVYWRRKCRTELEINPATVAILDIRLPKPGWVPLPGWLWRKAASPFVAGSKWISTGMLDPVVLQRAGLRWTWTDETLLRVYGKVVQLGYGFLPESLRLHERALAGVKRGRRELPPDAPLPQAPRTFQPSKNTPEHYLPDGDITGLIAASMAWMPVLAALTGAAYCRWLAWVVEPPIPPIPRIELGNQPLWVRAFDLLLGDDNEL